MCSFSRFKDTWARRRSAQPIAPPELPITCNHNGGFTLYNTYRSGDKLILKLILQNAVKGGAPMKNLKKIICPVDFSEPSDAALKSAVELAEHFSAEIILFHAINEIDPTPSPSYTLTHHLMDQIPQIMGQMTENAHKAMQDLIKNYVKKQIPADHRVVIGDPAKSIVKLAENEQADLIVIATHGRSGIKGMFFGSVAEKVVRSATCPVLTMKYNE
jgi:nucleotide-binding universal stress UspA family protein